MTLCEIWEQCYTDTTNLVIFPIDFGDCDNQGKANQGDNSELPGEFHHEEHYPTGLDQIAKEDVHIQGKGVTHGGCV